MEKPIEFQSVRVSRSLWTHFTPWSLYCHLESTTRATTNLSLPHGWNGIQAFLAVPLEWPFKGTANLSVSPSGLKF